MADLSYIQQPILSSHNAIKKLFLDFLEESKTVSTLRILESYDNISPVLISCLQHLLISNGYHYSGSLAISNIQEVYNQLSHPLGISVAK